jgi:disintegrin and metalloproteinase domain-containing protein 17
MRMLLCVAAVCSYREYASPLFMDIEGRRVQPQDLPRKPKFFMEFRAFSTDFRLELDDSSYKMEGTVLKRNICDFSVSLIGDSSSYGSISICNKISGAFVSEHSRYMVEGDHGRLLIEKRPFKPSLANGDTKDETEKDKYHYIKVFLVNDMGRVQALGPEVNADTREIFINAKKLIEGSAWDRYKIKLVLSDILNIVGGEKEEEDLMPEKAALEKRLRRFSREFERIKNDPYNLGSALNRANLVVLLRSRNRKFVEGLTYIGGATSPSESFSVINVSETDSYFYKGRTLAHEIAHSLGATHDRVGGFLMEEEGISAGREDLVFLSPRSIRQIESFIGENIQEFGSVDTCGNGILDGGKECDSGLAQGSICCTGGCRLRRGAECDDRNGRCCRGCRLLPRLTKCRDKPMSIHKAECHRDSYCDGGSPGCPVSYVRDGTWCSGGVCRRGMCETRALLCERLNRAHDARCPANGILNCLDEYDVCTPMYTENLTPIRVAPEARSRSATDGGLVYLIIPSLLLVLYLLSYKWITAGL